MKFELKRPCASCPFREDHSPGWLGEARAQEIAESIFGLHNGPFPCHKTLEYREGEDGLGCVPNYREQTQHCAGALILMEKEGKQSDCVQIAERLGHFTGRVYYDPTALDMSAPVFDTVDEFVRHHSTK